MANKCQTWPKWIAWDLHVVSLRVSLLDLLGWFPSNITARIRSPPLQLRKYPASAAQREPAQGPESLPPRQVPRARAFRATRQRLPSCHVGEMCGNSIKMYQVYQVLPTRSEDVMKKLEPLPKQRGSNIVIVAKATMQLSCGDWHTLHSLSTYTIYIYL